MASLGKREFDVSEMEEGKDICVHGIPSGGTAPGSMLFAGE